MRETANLDCGVVHFSTIKPLDAILLKRIIKNSKKIITVEENVKAGGFGSSILEFSSEISSKTKKAEIKIMSLKDKFLDKYGTQQELLEYSGLGYRDLSKKMRNFIKDIK